MDSSQKIFHNAMMVGSQGYRTKHNLLMNNPLLGDFDKAMEVSSPDYAARKGIFGNGSPTIPNIVAEANWNPKPKPRPILSDLLAPSKEEPTINIFQPTEIKINPPINNIPSYDLNPRSFPNSKKKQPMESELIAPTRENLTAISSWYDPIELMYHINPELTSFALARKSGWIESENLSDFVNFRGLQAQEKIAFMNNFANMIIQLSGIDSEERQNEVNARTKRDITDMVERGQTERQRISADVLLATQKLKYEIRRKIVENESETRKYLSDNEYKAIAYEALAFKEAVVLSADIRASAKKQWSADRLNERIKIAHSRHDTLLKAAEIQRLRDQDSNKRDIEIAYMQQQSTMFSAMARIEVAKIRSKADTDIAVFGMFGKWGQYLSFTLPSARANEGSIEGDYDGRHFNVTMRIKR